MDMRFVGIGMQGKTVSVFTPELFFKKSSSRVSDCFLRGSCRHGKNNVEGFTTLAYLRDWLSPDLRLPFMAVFQDGWFV